jgi:hypothetical protein
VPSLQGQLQKQHSVDTIRIAQILIITPRRKRSTQTTVRRPVSEIAQWENCYFCLRQERHKGNKNKKNNSINSIVVMNFVFSEAVSVETIYLVDMRNPIMMMMMTLIIIIDNQLGL